MRLIKSSSNSGRFLASLSEDNKLIIWDVNTGKELKSFVWKYGDVKSFFFSGDDKYLYINDFEVDAIDSVENCFTKLTAVREGNLYRIKKMRKKQEREIKKSNKKPFFTLRYIPDIETNKTLVDVSPASYSWNIASSEIVKLEVKHQNIQKSKTEYFSNDCNYRIYVKRASVIKRNISKNFVQDRSGFKRTADYFDEYFTSIDVSEKYKLIVAGNKDGKVYVYKLKNGRKVKNKSGKKIRQLTLHLSNVNDVAFSPSEDYFATASKDRTIIIWNSKTLTMEKRLAAQSFRNYSIAFNGTGEKLAIGNEFGDLRIIDLTSSGLDIKYFNLHIHPVSSVLFYEKDSIEYLVTAGYDHRSFIYNTSDEKVVKKFKYKKAPNPVRFLNGIFEKVLGIYRDPFAPVNAMALSQDHRYLILGGKTKNIKHSVVRVYDLKKSKSYRLVKHLDPISDLIFVNNQTFVSSNGSTSLCWWHLQKKKIYSREQIMDFPFKGVEFIDDETAILIGDSVIYIANLRNSSIKDSIKISANAFKYNSARQLLASGDKENLVHIYKIDDHSFKHKGLLKGHGHKITAIDFHPVKPILATASFDATVKLWNIEKNELLLTIVPIGKTERIAITSENYYMISKNKLNSVGFKVDDNFFYAEQFDLMFNRPDKVLKKLDYISEDIINLFEKTYFKRLKMLGFENRNFETTFEIPEVKILNRNKLPLTSYNNMIDLHINAIDSIYELNKLNVFLNDVPIFGLKGISLKDYHTQAFDTTINVELLIGENKLQVSGINANGAESYREAVQINYIPEKSELPDLYIIAVGVSNYKNSSFSLNYASKDAKDIVDLFREKKGLYKNIHYKVLADKDVTIENVMALRKLLEKAGRNDVVILFIAGHGVLDKNLDYYFASHDMDFDHPAGRGIIYNDIEALLDGLDAIRKLLFMDTCHSGELDKDEVELVQQEVITSDNVVFRNSGAGVRTKEGFGLQNTTELTKVLFSDIRKGTGTTVVSSAGGAEFAMESAKWNNGLFTYCLLNGLKTKKADLNKDGKIYLSEMQNYIRAKVTELSEGKQKPTSRIENISMDFRVW